MYIYIYIYMYIYMYTYLYIYIRQPLLSCFVQICEEQDLDDADVSNRTKHN